MRPAGTSGGAAALHVGSVRGRSAVLSSWAKSPICLLTPRIHGPSVWAYTSSYGGGMVAGDQTRLEVKIDPGARCFLGTQASTKIYRNPEQRPCSHRVAVTVGQDALLVLAPDPVQCFAESSYEQEQVFELATGASLILVDWVSGGRSARGERWQFQRYATRNCVRREGRTIFYDAMQLDNRFGLLQNRFRTGRFNCLATVVLLGPRMEQHSRESLARVADSPIQKTADLVTSASPLPEGAIFRIAGIRTEEVGQAIRGCLCFLPELLQGDPWARKW
jgi:urease accessory protein